LHKNGKIDSETGKLEIVVHYNKTKRGTDTFDQLAKMYTTARISNRWTMRLFYGMLDQGAINAFVLYYLREDNEKIHRREFLKDLAFNLIQPYLRKRLEVPTLRINLKKTIKEVLGEEDEVNVVTKLPKRKRCSMCPYSDDVKTMYCCAKCRAPVCEKHRTNFCLNCAA